MPSKNLRDALKGLTDQPLAYSKMCIVREKGSTDLLWAVEPVDSPEFIDKEAFLIDENKVVTQNMTNDELKASKKNWYFDVRLSAMSDVDIEAEVEDVVGSFSLPELNSFVIVSFLNEEDAYITMMSKVDAVKFKSPAGDFVMDFQTIFNFNKKVAEFKNSDIFSVKTNTPNIQLLIQDLIRLQNGDNIIEVNDASISLTALNDDADITLVANGNIRITTDNGTFTITPSGKFKIENNLIGLDDILLTQGISDYLVELNTTLGLVNTQLMALGQPGIAVNLSTLGNKQTTYINNVQKLF